MTDMKTAIIERAKIIVSKMEGALTPEDQRVLGQALMIGREKHPHNNAFGAWRKQHGFDALTLHQMSEALWLADEDNWHFFNNPPMEKGWNVRVARKMKNDMAKANGETPAQRIIGALKNHGTMSPQQIADETGLVAGQVQAILCSSPWAKHIKRGAWEYEPNAKLVNKPQTAADLQEFVKAQDLSRRVMDAMRNACSDGDQHKFWSSTTPYRDGTPFGRIHPLGETWKGDMEPCEPYTNADGKKVVGLAKGRMFRIIVDDIVAEVNANGETVGIKEMPTTE